MILYDDKTPDAIKTANQLLFPGIEHADDITFKASYIISGNLRCAGKVSALFDLIVFGDVIAEELDIKGRFVCMGRCSISGTMTVQNDIWAEDIQAASIICHDRIFAQSVDADTVAADGNIIIGKTLAVSQKVQTYRNVICGETAYGSGSIAAASVLTVEPLDLDDGECALESPFQYVPGPGASGSAVSTESASYAMQNDYSGFLSELMKRSDASAQIRLGRYLSALKAVDLAYPAAVSEFRDAALLIRMIEISHSDYFKDWPKVKEWTDAVLSHFRKMSEKTAELHEPKPAVKLEKGDTVLHRTYGSGVVCALQRTYSNGKPACVAVVSFELYGEKRFPLPDSLKFFSIVSEQKEASAAAAKSSIQCNVDSYSEWLSALQSIYTYKEYLGTGLYHTLYDLLLSKLGLKPRFVEERLKEKGWN